jgi:hypothetical protein
MAEEQQAKTPGRSDDTQPTSTVAGAADAGRERRRRVLLGGLAAAGPMIVTLASRPALGATGVCTVSGYTSINPSQATGNTQVCGDSPGCWKNKNYDSWPGMLQGFTPYQAYTHDTLLSDGTAIPALAKPPFTTANISMGNTIGGGGTVKATWTFSGTKSTTLWSAGQIANVTAALLNQGFYGPSNYFHPSSNVFGSPDVRSMINSYLTSNSSTNPGVIYYTSHPDGGTANKIATLMSSLDTILAGMNSQGELCPG